MNNELIINLARKAGFDPHDMSDDFTCNLENILELVRLVVGECSGILETEANTNWEGREERLLNAMGNWIKNHFGIE